MDNEMKYHVDRKVWQPLWYYIFEGTDFDNYCIEFENEVFKTIPYCWNEDYWDNSYHFWHKPSGFKIEWYKYPLRGAECNMDITASQFVDILYDCLNSLEKDKEVKFLHDVNKWWLLNE
jgi:hypothetical protein